MTTKVATIKYPYMPQNGVIKYVPANNKYMVMAKEFSRIHSLDKVMPTGAVIVKGGEVIGRGANGSTYHETDGCERVRLGIPTGQQYELCEGCSPKNHSEPRTIADAIKKGHQLSDAAELYLWGHWWACESCWKAVLGSGITTIYLQDDSENLFNKESPDNIVGKQFA